MKKLITIALILLTAAAQAQFISTASAAAAQPFAIDEAITTAIDEIDATGLPVVAYEIEEGEITTVKGINEQGDVVTTVTIVAGPCPPNCDEPIIQGPCPPNCD